MSKFYGTLKGLNGAVTRRGSAASGIQACAQSYDGSVITFLNYNDNGELIVTLEVAKDSNTYGEQLFKGTIAELKAKLS